MKNIITIAKKELRSYFNSPIAYVVALAFLLLWEFLFFRNVFLVGEVSLNGLFELLPWIFMIVVPALTMGALAEEKSEGTLEFLLTHPLSQIELIVGKFLGIVSFFAMALLFVFPLAWSFARFGNLDWGAVAAQYIASIFLTMTLVSLGIFISSFFSSVISAFLLSAIADFFLIIVGTEFFSNHFSLGLSAFLDQLSISNHFGSMSRGVIDLRDIWYFISLTAVFLGFTYLNLIKSKYGNRKIAYRNYQAGFVLLVGIVILSNIIGSRIPGRLDLTAEKIYTLSPATKDIMSDLPDIVNISFYFSDALPAQLQPVLRETKDILADYQRISKGKINITYKNPSSDADVAKEAMSAGVNPVRFNTVSQEQFQVNDGYLGMVISYGGKKEAIPFVQDVRDLEYQLSSLISELTVANKPKIGFISGHGEKSLSSDMKLMNVELKKQFDVVDIAAQGADANAATKGVTQKTAPATHAQPKTISIPDGVKTIVVADPQQDYSDQEKGALSDFVSKGGNIMFMESGVTISPQTFTATSNKSNLIEYIKNQTGVGVNNDLVYDLRSNESVSLGGGQMNYILPYPLWVRALKAPGNSPITSKLEGVTLPWPSSLSIDDGAMSGKGLEKTDLLMTSSYAGSETTNFDITPNHKFPSQGTGKKLMAVALSQKQGDGGRIVIVGDADFLGDQNVRSNPENLGFGLGAFSWLSQQSSLSQIKIKNLTDRKFIFASEADSSLIKFGNLGFALIAVSGYGAQHFWRRKKMKNDVYQS